MGTAAKDLRDALRRLAGRPRFALATAGILAVGVTTSTAVFGYVHAYARPFPGVRAEAVHQLWFATPQEPWGAVSYPDYRDLVELLGSGAVTGAGAGAFAASLRHELTTEVGRGASVTAGFFSTLEIDMAAGRGFSADDHLPGAAPTAILSYDYWVSRYGADADAVGEPILLNNEPYTIVGVAGPDFHGVSAGERPHFWLPFEQFLRVYRPGPGTRDDRESGAVVPIVTLADGTSPRAARAAVAAWAARLDESAPLAERTRRFVLAPATWISPGVRDAEASTTNVLMAAAVFLLLLACANVANLVLFEGAGRSPELAVRRAMGATSGRLARQSLTESVLLALPAAVLGPLFAAPVANRISSYFARPSVWGAEMPREIVLDVSVIAFALAVALTAGVVAGLVPALRASARSPARSLGRRGSTAPGRAVRRWGLGARHVLVALQIAIAVVLVFVASLVLRTLDAASRVDAGFDTEHTLASYVSTSSMGVPIPERHAFYRELRRRFEALPWVEAATVAENAPLSAHPSDRFVAPDGGDPVGATVVRAWPGYFETLGMERAGGRLLEEGDTMGVAGVAVVNEMLAGRLSSGGDVIGRSLVWPGVGEEGADASFEIVGVVRDARQVALLDPPDPVAYFSLEQLYSRPGNALLLKVRGDPAPAVAMTEAELRAVDPRLAIVNVLTYRDVVRGELYTQRMNAELFTVIAAIGLLLTAAGLFAVVALAVADRRRDIGIRLAIGAGTPAIARSVAASVGVSVLAGTLAGLAGAFASRGAVGALLWGVGPADGLALSFGAGVLLLVVLMAVGMPLRRALAVDPASSLRVE